MREPSVSWQKGQVEGPCRCLEGWPVEEWSWPHRARPHRRKAEGGRLKERTGFSLREVVTEGVNEDTV